MKKQIYLVFIIGRNFLLSISFGTKASMNEMGSCGFKKWYLNQIFKFKTIFLQKKSIWKYVNNIVINIKNESRYVI